MMNAFTARSILLTGALLSLNFAPALAGQPRTRTRPAPRAVTRPASRMGTPDIVFVRKAAQGGLAEVALGRLAVRNATNTDVKAFGARMVKDHSAANDELKDLARSKEIALPNQLSATDRKTEARLSRLRGTAFDRAYMSDMVKDHTKDVAAFERESRRGRDSQVKAWAGKTLPTLREHLTLAKRTDSALRKRGSKK